MGINIKESPRAEVTTDELEALFEEARRRARRRRLGYIAIGLIVGSVAALGYLAWKSGRTEDAQPGKDASADVQAPAGDDLYMRTLGTPTEFTSVDAGSGRIRHLRIPVGCGDTPHCLISVKNHLVIGGVGETELYRPGHQGARSVTKIGRGWISIASAVPGRAWTGILAIDPVRHRERRLSALREVDLAGKTTRTAVPYRGYWPDLASTRGLIYPTDGVTEDTVFRSFDSNDKDVELPGPPGAAYGKFVATCPDPCRQWRVTNVETRGVQRFQAPTGYVFRGGSRAAFSFDGRELAFTVFSRPSDTHRATGGVAVASPRLGSSSHLVPNSKFQSPQGLAWSQSRHQLYFVGNNAQVKRYDLSRDETTQIADLPRGASVLDMATVHSGG